MRVSIEELNWRIELRDPKNAQFLQNKNFFKKNFLRKVLNS